MTRVSGIAGKVHEDMVLPPGESWSGVVAKGDMLRIIDLEGQQAVDFLCLNVQDTSETYDSTVTIRIAKSIYLNKGVKLYSNISRPLFTIEEDTVGDHDTICGCCSREINLLRYGFPNSNSCRDNFLRQLGKHGLDSRSVVPNINFFMYIPADANGRIDIKPARSKPGDFVDLRAEMDVLAVVSNCPGIRHGLKPIRLVRFSKPPM